MGSKLYRTPAFYFAQRWDLYHFTVDAAADYENAWTRPHEIGKCHYPHSIEGRRCKSGPCNLDVRIRQTEMQRTVYPQTDVLDNYIGRYYTEETNGLEPSRYAPMDRVWCNPPFVNLIAWVRMARELSQDLGVLWDMLLPASTDAQWFKEIWNDDAGHWRDGVDAHFIGRLKFIDPVRVVDSPRAGNLQVTFWPKGIKP